MSISVRSVYLRERQRGVENSGGRENSGISKSVVGEPMVCTPDSHGFRHFCGFRDSANAVLSPLVCGCLSCLHRFRDSRRFMKATRLQTIGLANHRLRNTLKKAIRALSQKCFGPPLMIRFPSPRLSTPCHFS